MTDTSTDTISISTAAGTADIAAKDVYVSTVLQNSTVSVISDSQNFSKLIDNVSTKASNIQSSVISQTAKSNTSCINRKAMDKNSNDNNTLNQNTKTKDISNTKDNEKSQKIKDDSAKNNTDNTDKTNSENKTAEDTKESGSENSLQSIKNQTNKHNPAKTAKKQLNNNTNILNKDSLSNTNNSSPVNPSPVVSFQDQITPPCFSVFSAQNINDLSLDEDTVNMDAENIINQAAALNVTFDIGLNTNKAAVQETEQETNNFISDLTFDENSLNVIKDIAPAFENSEHNSENPALNTKRQPDRKINNTSKYQNTSSAPLNSQNKTDSGDLYLNETDTQPIVRPNQVLENFEEKNFASNTKNTTAAENLRNEIKSSVDEIISKFKNLKINTEEETSDSILDSSKAGVQSAFNRISALINNIKENINNPADTNFKAENTIQTAKTTAENAEDGNDLSENLKSLKEELAYLKNQTSTKELFKTKENDISQDNSLEKLSQYSSFENTEKISLKPNPVNHTENIINKVSSENALYGSSEIINNTNINNTQDNKAVKAEKIPLKAEADNVDLFENSNEALQINQSRISNKIPNSPLNEELNNSQNISNLDMNNIIQKPIQKEDDRINSKADFEKTVKVQPKSDLEAQNTSDEFISDNNSGQDYSQDLNGDKNYEQRNLYFNKRYNENFSEDYDENFVKTSTENLNSTGDFRTNENTQSTSGLEKTAQTAEELPQMNLKDFFEQDGFKLLDEVTFINNGALSDSGALSVSDEIAKIAMDSKSSTNLGSLALNQNNNSIIKNISFAKALAQNQNLQSKMETNNVMGQISERLQTLKDGVSQRLTMVLRPSDLGRLSIELTTNQNGLTTNILAQNSDVRNYIEKNIETLRQQLTNAGVNVNTIQIKTAGETGTSVYNGNQNHDNSQQNSAFQEQNHDGAQGKNSGQNHHREKHEQNHFEKANYDMYFAKNDFTDFSSVLMNTFNYSLN